MFSVFRKNKNEQKPIHSLNCIRLIQAHIDYRNQIEDFVNGQLIDKPKMQVGCQAECKLGKVLHSESGKHYKDAVLLDSLCNSCEEFREAAAQVVLFTEMGKMESKEIALPLWSKFSVASEEFQNNLATFHLTYINVS